MKGLRLAAAAVILACSVGAGLAAIARIEPPAPTVTPVLTTGTTILGQPIVYPDGRPLVTSSIVTLPPGGVTGWHTHAVPLFGYVLEGTLTVDYGERGTRTYPVGAALMEAVDWAHNGMNMTDAPVRILTVHAGSEDLPNATPVEQTR